MNLMYQDLSAELNWELFTGHLLVPSQDRQEIKYLTESAASELWTDLFSAEPSQVCHSRLPATHWARQFVTYGPAWDRYANEPSLPDEVVPFLRSVLPWDEEEQILVVHVEGYALTAPLRVFMKHWRSFIAKNDDPILFRLDRPEFVLFGDTGMLAVGRRPVPEPTENRGCSLLSPTPPFLCPRCTAVLQPWADDTQEQSCPRCGHRIKR